MNDINQYFQDMVAKEVERQMLERFGPPGKAEEAKNILAGINAKQFITTKEAAFLLSCSPSHIRHLVRTSKNNKTSIPIPYTMLGDIMVFDREKLLEWASFKPNLRVLKTEAA